MEEGDGKGVGGGEMAKNERMVGGTREGRTRDEAEPSTQATRKSIALRIPERYKGERGVYKLGAVLTHGIYFV